MKRVWWHEANWSASLRSITSGLRKNVFGPDDNDGFMIQRVRADSIEATHIEKFVTDEVIVDPFNNEQVIERTSYRKISFRLSSEFPQLEVRDPPRLLNGFFSSLSEATIFELSVRNVAVDLAKWLACLENIAHEPLLVDVLQIGALQVEEGIGASVLLRGDKDVRLAMAKLTQRKPHVLDRMHLQLPLPSGSKTAVTIHRSGTATLGSGQTEEAVVLLRNAFAKAFGSEVVRK